MTFEMITILVFVVSIVASALMYPLALGYAKRHNIVDNPNARKLQRVPVPVMGGLVVYTGMLAGILVLYAFVREPLLLWGLLGITIMLVEPIREGTSVKSRVMNARTIRATVLFER